MGPISYRIMLSRWSTGSTLTLDHPTPPWMAGSLAARLAYWTAYYRHRMPGWRVLGHFPIGHTKAKD